MGQSVLCQHVNNGQINVNIYIHIYIIGPIWWRPVWLSSDWLCEWKYDTGRSTCTKAEPLAWGPVSTGVPGLSKGSWQRPVTLSGQEEKGKQERPTADGQEHECEHRSPRSSHTCLDVAEPGRPRSGQGTVGGGGRLAWFYSGVFMVFIIINLHVKAQNVRFSL